MNKQYDIIGNRKKFFLFSAILIAFILLFSLIFGVEMDIQFKGGAMLTYGYEGEAPLSDVQRTIEQALGSSVTLQTGSSIATGAQTLTISMPGTQTVETATVEALGEALAQSYPELGFRQLSMNNVDPTIGKEFFLKSVVAVVAASLLILVYIAIRFKKIGGWPAGCMAIVALIHDLIVVFGVFVLMRVPLNGNFIAALLTILGYSINDTVVIYDRVRENRALYGNSMDFATLVNTSINQSLVRSVKTTISTLLALGTVCVVSVIFGLDSIFTFAFPLIVGMISGVYSTVCIAGPLWVEWETRKARPGKSKKA